MATLVHLGCETCKEYTCLGKWLRHEDYTGFGFWRGAISIEGLGTKTLNFLAIHTNHKIVILDDLQFEEYLGDWRWVEDDLSTTWPEDEMEKPPF